MLECECDWQNVARGFDVEVLNVIGGMWGRSFGLKVLNAMTGFDAQVGT
jgi:hypothetical protein